MSARINSIWQRLKYEAHVFFIDHGMFRALYWNKAQIAPGVYRSNYPTSARIKRLKRQGVNTILSLRGQFDGAFNALERDACERHDVMLTFVPLGAREAPKARRILDLLKTFREIDRPFLMHCKSGADRAGLASAIYLMVIEGKPVSTAKKMLSPKYLHIRNKHVGILDYLLECYEAHSRQTPMDFETWVATVYDPEQITARFRAGQPAQ